MNSNAVFVGNVSIKTTKERLELLFVENKLNPIDIYIPQHHCTGKSKFCYALFRKVEEAESAIAIISNKEIDGQILHLKYFTIPFPALPAPCDVIMYEANERVFGTHTSLNVIAGRLDHIASLGVNVLWLMPVCEQGLLKAKGSPYAVKNYLKVEPEYGTLEDLRLLVQRAHLRSLAVILDWVANHTSWDNAWIISNKKTWYAQDSEGNIISPSGRHSVWADVACLNYKNSEMRSAMMAAMQYWVLEVHAGSADIACFSRLYKCSGERGGDGGEGSSATNSSKGSSSTEEGEDQVVLVAVNVRNHEAAFILPAQYVGQVFVNALASAGIGSHDDSGSSSSSSGGGGGGSVDVKKSSNGEEVMQLPTSMVLNPFEYRIWYKT